MGTNAGTGATRVSEEHRRFIADVDIHRCPRCTFGPYNEIMERVIESDAMCMNFP